jgi:phosphatidate cytidylyltransferase
MLKDRLRTSAILISIISALLYLDASYSRPGAEGLWLLPLLLFFALGTAQDICGLLVDSGRCVARHAALLGTLIVSLSAGLPLAWPLTGNTYPLNCPVGRLGWIVIGGILALSVVLITEMRRYGKVAAEHNAIERIGAGSFISLYVGMPMAMLVALRSLGDGNWGLAALLTMIAVTKSADAGAYFAGKTMGKRKLIPRLSPGKTWEGLLGGIVTATIVAYLCLRFLFPWIAGSDGPPAGQASLAFVSQPLWGALLLGPILTIAGLIGDLAESLVKRDTGAKDSGNLLPGLGGVWDVTDSLIASAMPAFLCFAAGVGW